MRRRRTRMWCGRNLFWAWGIQSGKPSTLRCASALLAGCKVLQGCLCQPALCALNPATSNENKILPRKENTILDALNEPLRSNNFHMLELADLCWGEGTSNNMRAITVIIPGSKDEVRAALRTQGSFYQGRDGRPHHAQQSSCAIPGQRALSDR